MSKRYDTLDSDGISVRDLSSLEPELLKKKYLVNIILNNGQVRYLYLDTQIIAELYVEIIGAKILKITSL